MRERTRVLIYLLFTTVVVASCSRQTSPLAPEEQSDIQPSLSVATAGCPSVEQAAAELKPIVQKACPPDSTYRNNGERNNCRKDAFKDAIKPYKRCFTSGQINAIRRLVFRGNSSGPYAKEGTIEFHEQPELGQ